MYSGVILVYMSFLFFIFGLIVGSFLNVVVYRFRSGEGGIVTGSSHCRSCRNALGWQDNIPLVSYILLRGRCRQCKAGISLQYPLVEFLTGVSFSFAYFCTSVLYDLSGGILIGIALITSFLFAVMLLIFVYDYKYMEVPMAAIWWGVFFTFLLIMFFDFILEDTFVLFSSHFFLHGMAGLIAFLFFFGMSYYSDERWMGYGDSFIALVIGFFLGPLGTFFAILFAVWSGATVGILLTLTGAKGMKSAIPFGPFLVSGFFVAFYVMAYHPHLMRLFW